MTLPFSLVICTYMRPKALVNLLDSVAKQSLHPDEIIIIDGSLDSKTKAILATKSYNNIRYYLVDHTQRGLTKQRNLGITKIAKTSKIVCFLDDDIILEPNYFEALISTYTIYPKALAVGGYIINEIHWEKSRADTSKYKFYYDGWMRNEPSRFRIRKKMGLQPDSAPGYLPTFSHGRSISFLPPSGKIYEVEQIMGGVSSYKTSIFSEMQFSTYFEGYGLYEDADFSLRLAKIGKLYVNTKAQLSHYHEPSGRPNQYNYGKMVVRNGWYVWRVKYEHPTAISSFKFYAVSLLLTCIRATNIATTKEKQKALTETLGRIIGLFSLVFNPPKSI